MTVDEAKAYAEQHFPQGPEKLAQHLKIDVEESALTGCDGWVLAVPGQTLIRINSASIASRKRFTLAHELGHLLLGIPTVIGESVYDSLRSHSTEEKRVNALAAELLLPGSIVKKHLKQLPVVAADITKLSKLAKVSQLMVAIRVANLAPEIGLENSAVTFFRNEKLDWNYSKTLDMPESVAEALLKAATKSDPAPVRISRKKQGDVIVASILPNPNIQSVTLFVQLLNEEDGNTVTSSERRRELEQFLFADDDQFRMQMQGVFGGMRPKCAGMTLAEAIKEFYDKKIARWTGTRSSRILSKKGREYVRLRFQEWCSDET